MNKRARILETSPSQDKLQVVTAWLWPQKSIWLVSIFFYVSPLWTWCTGGEHILVYILNFMTISMWYLLDGLAVTNRNHLLLYLMCYNSSFWVSDSKFFTQPLTFLMWYLLAGRTVTSSNHRAAEGRPAAATFSIQAVLQVIGTAFLEVFRICLLFCLFVFICTLLILCFWIWFGYVFSSLLNTPNICVFVFLLHQPYG